MLCSEFINPDLHHRTKVEMLREMKSLVPFVK
jgi:hypothetical protein